MARVQAETLVAYNNRLGDDVERSEDKDIATIFNMANITSIKPRMIDTLRQLSLRLNHPEALQHTFVPVVFYRLGQ